MNGSPPEAPADRASVPGGSADARPADALRQVALLLRRIRRGIAWRWTGWGLEALSAAGLAGLAFWGFGAQYTRLEPQTQLAVGWAWWITLTALALGVFLLVRRLTPRREALALRLETQQPALAGCLLASLQALEHPAAVPSPVAGICAERAAQIIQVTDLRSLHPPPPWYAAHLGLLGALTLMLLGLATYGLAFVEGFAGEFGVRSPEFGAEHTHSAPRSTAGILPAPTVPQASCLPQYFGLRTAHSAVRQVAVLVEPPRYTGQPPRWEVDPRGIQAVVGSDVTVLLKAAPSATVGAGFAELPGGKRAMLERLPEAEGLAAYRARFTTERSGLLRLGLAVARSAGPPLQVLLPVGVVLDQPPEADAVIAEEAGPSGGGLPIELRLQDDFGLTAARLALKALPPEAGAPWRDMPPDAAYEIPLPPGCRLLSERWRLPREGLEAYLAAGFQYRVEATDNAAPDAHIACSAWRRYLPVRKGRPQEDRSALLEPPRSTRPRSLIRADALSRIPDPTPEELTQLGPLGSGVPAKRQLERPRTERLQERQPSSGSPQGAPESGTAPRPAPGAGQGQGYDLPQGLSGEKKEGGAAGGEPSAGGKAGGAEPGGAGPGRRQRGDQGQAEGRGSEQGGEGAGQGATGVSPAGGEGPTGGDARGSSKGAGGRGQGTRGGAPGGETSGEGAGESGTDPGGGAGGPQPRDDGFKTGREAGPGAPEMGPPDLATLARMKEVSFEEARRYAAERGLVAARTDFGQAISGPAPPPRGAAQVRQPFGAFQLRESAAPGKETRARAAAGPVLPELPVEQVDQIYRALVDGYFRRMNEGRGWGLGTGGWGPGD